MTRLDLADSLSLSLETVCRAVARLKKAELVRFEGRHRVILLHPSELARFAGHDDVDDVGAITHFKTATGMRHDSLPPPQDLPTQTKALPLLSH